MHEIDWRDNGALHAAWPASSSDKGHMLRRQVPAASATAIVVAFAVIVSCSDSVGPGSDTPFEDPDGSINLLAGGGWNPAVKAAGAKAGKINICHSGSGKNFTSINVSVNATRAHLGDELTGI